MLQGDDLGNHPVFGRHRPRFLPLLGLQAGLPGGGGGDDFDRIGPGTAV